LPPCITTTPAAHVQAVIVNIEVSVNYHAIIDSDDMTEKFTTAVRQALLSYLPSQIRGGDIKLKLSPSDTKAGGLLVEAGIIPQSISMDSVQQKLEEGIDAGNSPVAATLVQLLKEITGIHSAMLSDEPPLGPGLTASVTNTAQQVFEMPLGA